MKRIFLSIVVVLAGCASSSGVLRSGPDLFTVTATASPGGGGETTAKKSAYSDASIECSKNGRAVSVISEKVTAPTWTNGMHSIDLVFRCAG
jgi:hypothetical protein